MTTEIKDIRRYERSIRRLMKAEKNLLEADTDVQLRMVMAAIDGLHEMLRQGAYSQVDQFLRHFTREVGAASMRRQTKLFWDSKRGIKNEE